VTLSVPFTKLEAHGAGDALLRNAEKSVERFPSGANQNRNRPSSALAQRERLLKMRGLAVDRQTLEFLMRLTTGFARSFVRATDFIDEAIFDGSVRPMPCSRQFRSTVFEKIDRTEIRTG